MIDNELKVDWGDGVSAVERVTRAIVMLIDDAIRQLVEAGYVRERIIIEADDDGVTIPAYVQLDDERVYEVTFGPGVEGPIQFLGHWLDAAPNLEASPTARHKRSFWDVVFGRE